MPEAAETIRVFLLDDHEVVRRGVRELLEAEGDIEVVGESGSAADATEQIPAIHPDVAVLDRRLPDGSGVEVCRDVRAVHPDIAVLILTSYDDDAALCAAALAGASGYVLKQITGTALVDGVRKVAAGGSMLEAGVADRLLAQLQESRPRHPALRGLTGQEERILMLIADGRTNRQIGECTNLAEKTVKNYVSSILSKLGLERRTQAGVLASRLR